MWTAFFLPAGALAVACRSLDLWRRIRPMDARLPGCRPGLPAAAADLAFLIALQQGFIQAQVESGRGNIIGMILCLSFVTPILALLTWKLVSAAGNKLASKLRKWYPIC